MALINTNSWCYYDGQNGLITFFSKQGRILTIYYVHVRFGLKIWSQINYESSSIYPWKNLIKIKETHQQYKTNKKKTEDVIPEKRLWTQLPLALFTCSFTDENFNVSKMFYLSVYQISSKQVTLLFFLIFEVKIAPPWKTRYQREITSK